MKKRSIVAFISLLLASVMLTSCAGVTSHSTSGQDGTAGQTEDTAAPAPIPEDETIYRHSGNPDYPVWAKAYLKALPERDMNGATFFITSPSTGLYDPSEIHFISDVVVERNRMVEEKYNINIEVSKTNSATMLEEASKAALAGMYYTNIMCIPFSDAGAFDNAGLLTNLRSLPHLDLSMPYFNQTSVNALSVGYRTIGVAGEATPVTDLPCIIYNKAIASELGLNDLYDVAINGELTWDRLLQYSDECFATGKYAGAVLSGGESYDWIFKSLGEYYVSAAPLKVPTSAVQQYSLDWTATYARKIIADAESFGITKDSAVSAFREGKALFTVCRISGLDTYRSTDVEIGILPMPRKDSDNPYRSAVDGNALIMTIPKNSTNSEMASLVLSALNAASYGYISETVVDYLHATVLPDNRSADVLDVMTRSAVYDLSTGFAATIPSLTAQKEYLRLLIDTGDFSSFKSVMSAVDLDLAKQFPLKY